MEEIKCCLLGFSSTSLRLSSPAPAAGSHLAPPPPPLLPVPAISNTLRSQLHPSELALLENVLPLGSAYASLHSFASGATGARHASSTAASARTVQQAGASAAGGLSTHTSLYAAALRVGVKEVLERYVDTVKNPALCSISALTDLEHTFGPTLRRLVELAETARVIEADRAALAASACEDAPVPRFLRQWDEFTRHEGLPVDFRACIGESVWLSLLFTTAHFVAHGLVLHGRQDFFLQLDDATTTTTTTTLHAQRGYVLLEAYLPPGISFDVALSVLAAGRERRLLLGEAAAEQHRAARFTAAGEARRVRGRLDGVMTTSASASASAPSPHATASVASLAMGAQDEVAEAVFHTIFHPSLCAGGRLAEEELAARVDAARSLWSRALWIKVKDPCGVLPPTASPAGAAVSAPSPRLTTTTRAALTSSSSSLRPTLFHHLSALQDMFLCQRGDVWHMFVERTYEVVVPAPTRTQTAMSTSAGGGGGSALAMAETNVLLYRRAEESFMAALAEVGLADDVAYTAFDMHVADRCPSLEPSASPTAARRGRSSEDIATIVLARVEALELRYALPSSGLGLVITDKTLAYYQQLFSFQLSVRFALHALYQTRHAFTEALLTNTAPSAELRRAYQLLHTLLFIVSAIREYGDVDVTAPAARELARGMQRCRSVEEAKQRHDQFIWTLAEGCFLTQTGAALRAACQAACRCALVLHLVCRRFGVVYWAVEGVNEVPPEVAAVLAALETRLQQDIVAVCLGHLGVASRAAERALWVRLDFNRFFSQGLRAPTATATTPTTTTTTTGRGQYAGVAASATAPGLSPRTTQKRGRRPSSHAAPTGPVASAVNEETPPEASGEGRRGTGRPRSRTPTRQPLRRASTLSATSSSAAVGASTRRSSVLTSRGEAPEASEAPPFASNASVMERAASPWRAAEATATGPTAPPASHVVFSVPAVRSFATAAYPGGVAPPQPTPTSASSSVAASHVVAAIAARQAALTANAHGGSKSTSSRAGVNAATGAPGVRPSNATLPTSSTAPEDEERASTVRTFREPNLAAIAASAATRTSRARAPTATNSTAAAAATGANVPPSLASSSARGSHVDVQPRSAHEARNQGASGSTRTTTPSKP